MLASRVAFVDSTNSWNQRSLPHSRLSFPPKFALSSRKCLLTCTVSLASASSTTANLNDLRISIDIDIAPSATSIIPFPSSSSDIHSSISQPDPTCLLRSQPEPQLLNRSSSARRKRLCQPIVVPKSAAASVAAGTSSSTSGQPPRKRPRLHKGAKVKKALHAGTGTAKGAWYLSTPELRFMAVLQRSVAHGVLEQQEPGFGGSMNEPCGRKSACKRDMEVQDRELARRLRTCLLERGFRDSDVVDLDVNLRDRSDDTYINMDMEVDVGVSVSAGDSPEPSPADVVDMDIDVEPLKKRLTLPPKPSTSRSRSQSTKCTPYRSPSPSPPPSNPPTLSHSQLVASLTMRYRSRVAVRSHGQSSIERMLSTEPRMRTVSPLARFEPYTES